MTRIYQKAKEFLLSQFKRDQLLSEFPQALQKEFWELFSDDEFQEKELFKKEVHHAFATFFEPAGVATIVLKEKQLFLKVTPYSCTIDEGNVIQKLTTVLNTFKESIISESRKDLYLINLSEHLELQQIIHEHHADANKKSLITKAIRLAYQLNKEDVVTYVNNRIAVRLHHVVKAQKEGAEKRFNGLPAEELANIQTRIFPEGIQNFFKTVVDALLSDKLNFKKINNQFFMQNSIKLFQEQIIHELKPILVESDDVLFGFANYLLRQVFENMYLRLSENLLDLILSEDKNVEKFLKYYNGAITINSDGQKVQAPLLLNSIGVEYKYVTLLSIAKQHQVKEKQLYVIKKAVHDHKVTLKKCNIKLLTGKKALKEKRDIIQKLKVDFDEKNVLRTKLKSEIENVEKNHPRYKTTDKYKTTLSTYKESNSLAEKLIDEIKSRTSIYENESENVLEIAKEHKTISSALGETQEELQLSREKNSDTNRRYQEIVQAVAKILMQKAKRLT